MSSYIQLFFLTLIGIVLLWLGYTLFFGLGRGGGDRGQKGPGRKSGKKGVRGGTAGAPRTCPICAAKLENGERVQSTAFPSSGRAGRLMYISGCVYCLSSQRERICPVCGSTLEIDDYLVARMFDKPGRSHVHVLGCNRCHGPALGHENPVIG